MRLTPEGVIDRVIGVPVQRPTAVALGGRDLDVLYVTTSTYPLPDSCRRKQPHAGALLAISGLGRRGVVESRFAG